MKNSSDNLNDIGFVQACGLVAGSPEAEIALKIRNVFAEQLSGLKPEEISADMTGAELIATRKPKHWWQDGFDSVELVIGLEKEIGRDIPDEVAERLLSPYCNLELSVRDFVVNYLDRFSRLDTERSDAPYSLFFYANSQFTVVVSLILAFFGVLLILFFCLGLFPDLFFSFKPQPWLSLFTGTGLLLFAFILIHYRGVTTCDRFTGEIRQRKKRIDISLYRAIQPVDEYVLLEAIDYCYFDGLVFPCKTIAPGRAAQIAAFFNLPLEPVQNRSILLYRAWNPADWGREARPFFRAVAALCAQCREAGYSVEVTELEDRLRKSCYLTDSRRYVTEFQQKLPESLHISLESFLTRQLQKLLREAALMETSKNSGLARKLREIAQELSRNTSDELLSAAAKLNLSEEIGDTIDEIRFQQLIRSTPPA